MAKRSLGNQWRTFYEKNFILPIQDDIDKENNASSQVDADENENEANDTDTTTIAGLLETCVIIWEGIKDQLDKVRYW